MARLIYLFCVILSLSACVQNPVKNVEKTLAMQLEADRYYADSQCDKALPIYIKLSATMPKETKSLLRIGNCHAKAKDFVQAQAAYQQAIVRDNNFVKAWYNLAYVQAQQLASTVSKMYKHIDKNAPEAQKIRNLTVGVLAPFEIKIDDTSDVKE